MTTTFTIPTPLGSQVEIKGGDVEIALSADRRKLWINHDGICRLRAHEANITIETRGGNDNLLTKAIHAATIDEAVKPIQDALGIETGDVAGLVFSGCQHSWPTMSWTKRASLIASWLAVEVSYADPSSPSLEEEKRNADRIDGYDRDDLSESPDY